MCLRVLTSFVGGIHSPRRKGKKHVQRPERKELFLCLLEKRSLLYLFPFPIPCRGAPPPPASTSTVKSDLIALNAKGHVTPNFSAPRCCIIVVDRAPAAAATPTHTQANSHNTAGLQVEYRSQGKRCHGRQKSQKRGRPNGRSFARGMGCIWLRSALLFLEAERKN